MDQRYLSCVWYEEGFYTAGPLPCNGADDLIDEKPWIYVSLRRSHSDLTFHAFRLSTSAPLMLPTNQLAIFALYAQNVL